MLNSALDHFYTILHFFPKTQSDKKDKRNRKFRIDLNRDSSHFILKGRQTTEKLTSKTSVFPCQFESEYF